MNTEKGISKQEENYQAGKFSKFLDFMFPKAERSETDRMQYIGTKIKLLFDPSSAEYSEFYVVKCNHIYTMN